MSGWVSVSARRSAYTGEPLSRASTAVGDLTGHGLDFCSAGQRRFRALLSLLACNSDNGGENQLTRWQLDWSVAGSITYSPEQHALVVLTPIPHLLAAAALVHPDPVRRQGLPGLRPLNAHPDGLWFRLRHVPTRTLLRIEAVESETAAVHPQVPIAWEIASRSWEILPEEDMALRSVPPMHVDAEQLLAAMLVRLGTDEPDGRWHVGATLARAHDRGAPSPLRSLWGRGRHWQLVCRDRAVVTGLCATLTGPEIGLAGAVLLERTRSTALIGHREATLRLVGPG